MSAKHGSVSGPVPPIEERLVLVGSHTSVASMALRVRMLT